MLPEHVVEPRRQPQRSKPLAHRVVPQVRGGRHATQFSGPCQHDAGGWRVHAARREEWLPPDLLGQYAAPVPVTLTLGHGSPSAAHAVPPSPRIKCCAGLTLCAQSSTLPSPSRPRTSITTRWRRSRHCRICPTGRFHFTPPSADYTLELK